ncbi:hypothetical protein KEM56_002911 [Ascosphaera pollenicola]|nr:hypothetical protein KEM56_002911 [Ascosphaera pollenicola]
MCGRPTRDRTLPPPQQSSSSKTTNSNTASDLAAGGRILTTQTSEPVMATAETVNATAISEADKLKAHSQIWTMESRVGRTNQRYSPNGNRLVAGVVPLSQDKTHVLVIQSARRSGWVLPKGGWELDEDTPAEAACREAWEEAGVICTVTRDLGTLEDQRSEEKLAKSKSKRSRACYHFFEVEVEREESCWPEGHKRRREWVGYERAKEVLAERPELLEALERSSIVKR